MDIKLALTLKRIEAKLDRVLALLDPSTAEHADPTPLSSIPVYSRLHENTVKSRVEKHGQEVARLAMRRLQERIASGHIPDNFTKTVASGFFSNECDKIELERQAKQESDQKGRALVLLVKRARGGLFSVGQNPVYWNGNHYVIDGKKTDWAQNQDAYLISLGRKSGWEVKAQDAKAEEAMAGFKMFQEEGTQLPKREDLGG